MGGGVCWGGKRWPGDKKKKPGVPRVSLLSCRPLRPIPEPPGHHVSVLRTSEGPPSREEGTWRPVPSRGRAQTGWAQTRDPASRTAPLLDLRVSPTYRPAHWQPNILKVRGPRQRRSSFPWFSVFLISGWKSMSATADTCHPSLLSLSSLKMQSLHEKLLKAL